MRVSQYIKYIQSGISKKTFDITNSGGIINILEIVLYDIRGDEARTVNLGSL